MDNIPKKMRSQINETVKISVMPPKTIVDQLTSISIPANDIKIK